jgi:ATP-dependent RNA helicase DeaD
MFVCPDQGEPLTAIELLINKPIPTLELDGFVAYQRQRRSESVFRELFNTVGQRSFAR